jgi:hypothetical protein
VNRTVNGVVTVQHNIAQVTATSTFDNVVYGDIACCFPTSGKVTTLFSKGPDKTKTETLEFNGTCGSATLTEASGASQTIILRHCM